MNQKSLLTKNSFQTKILLTQKFVPTKTIFLDAKMFQNTHKKSCTKNRSDSKKIDGPQFFLAKNFWWPKKIFGQKQAPDHQVSVSAKVCITTSVEGTAETTDIPTSFVETATPTNHAFTPSIIATV